MYEARRRVGTASTADAERGQRLHEEDLPPEGHRARASRRPKAPILRGGGVAHGPKPRDYWYSMPRKALLKALRIALAGKLRDGEVLRWEGAPLPGEEPSTRTVRRVCRRSGRPAAP